MGRGRPRKPAKVLEMSGSFRKNPKRRKARAGELLEAPGIGAAPAEWLEGAEHNGRCGTLLGIWREIVAQDVLGVLNVSHRTLVETTCLLLYKVRRASAGNGKATSGDYAQIKSNLAAMGMTPVDSGRVSEAARGHRGASPQKAPGATWGELVG